MIEVSPVHIAALSDSGTFTSRRAAAARPDSGADPFHREAPINRRSHERPRLATSFVRSTSPCTGRPRSRCSASASARHSPAPWFRQLAARFYTGGIDISRLPDDVAALIDALRPGEELAITRDGLPIATISGAGGALHGEIVAPSPLQEDTEQPQAGYADVTVVATAMKLPDAARASLSDQLGSGYIVVDMQSAPATADVLLVPPISPQLIGHLRSMFPKARIVAAEFEDDTLGISYLGAIRRMLDAGAETYLASSTIPQLARQLDRVITERHQLTTGTDSQLEIEPPRNG